VEEDVSLRSKMLALMTIPVIGFVAAGILAYTSEVRTDQVQREVARKDEIKEGLQRVQADLLEIETGVRGYLLTGKEAFLESYNRGVARLSPDLVSFQTLIRDPLQKRRLEQVWALATERLTILRSLRASGPPSDPRERAEMVRVLLQALPQRDRLHELVEVMIEHEEGLLMRREDALAAARRTSHFLEFVGGPILISLGLGVMVAFTARLLRRIKRVRINAERLEQGVPLEQPDHARDELGQLSKTLVETGHRVLDLHQQLRRIATIDPLTGLTNRRGFMPLAEHQLRMAERHGLSVALLFVDVDGLKAVNDRQGHDVGDAMICETGMLLRTTFRATDLVARIGGDEFCILLTGNSVRDAKVATERLFEAVAAANEEPDRSYGLSISAGLVQSDPANPVSVERLMREADDQMYAHKRIKRAHSPLSA
jgi:diguanylate cyclase (GGDEF)-like protein